VAAKAESVREQAGGTTHVDAEPHDGWLTRHDVARLLEISLMSVRRRQETGELIGELVCGQWLFAPEEVDALAGMLALRRSSSWRRSSSGA
jgi:hypothetical protein